MFRFTALRRGASILAAGSLLAIGGCDTVDSLLEAKNPDAINEDQLDDETLATVLANSVVGALTSAYDEAVLWRGSHITDDQVSGINWPSTRDLGRRILPYDQGDADLVFSQLSRYRFMGDSMTTRLNNLLEEPQADKRMAMVLALSGYSYTLMAEYLCEATIDMGATKYNPTELANMAIERFEKAITVATAAGVEADTVKWLAYTGLARAATAAGNKAKVMEAASKVPSDFIWWVEYKTNSQENYWEGQINSSNHTVGLHPNFLKNWGSYGDTVHITAQTDPRVQFNKTPRTGHDGSTILYTPYPPLSFSDYTGGRQTDVQKPGRFTDDTDIRLGSYLDAMHNYYEAAGPNGNGPEGSTLDFVNKRRAVGMQEPVNLSGSELMAELREQRRRDLFLGGFRLGDLRRWKAQGVGDFFPTGTHPNHTLGEYGDAECFPIPLAEYVGNPNITR